MLKMYDTAFTFLLRNKPNWVTISKLFNSEQSIQISVSPKLIGDTEGQRYELTLQRKDDNLVVFETDPGSSLPKACLERHINHDSSFCLGLDVGKKIESNEAASDWWEFLRQFLIAQQVSEKRGVWPPDNGLSHGSAAYYQVEMEKIASELGWDEEVKDALSYKQGWLASELPKIRHNSMMLLNQRHACPRGCKKTKGKHLRSISRRKCPNKEAIAYLVSLEINRRQKEVEFNESYTRKGMKCCQTMKSCPLKTEET